MPSRVPSVGSTRADSVGMTPPPLRSMLDPRTVANLAGSRSYSRGLGYHGDGRVRLVRVDDNAVEAVVRGTVPYVVNLRVDDGELDSSCTCPMGDDGEFCKHCVATALTLTDGEGGNEAVSDAQRRSTGVAGTSIAVATHEPDLRSFVESLPVDALVELVMEQTRDDWRLRERLTAQAAAELGAGIDLASWRQQLTTAFAASGYDDCGFVDYRSATHWARGTHDALDALDDLLGAGHADAVVALCEHAHHEATSHGTDDQRWLTLARAREAAHPIDAIEVYERQIPVLIGRKKNDAYAAAVDLMARVKRCPPTPAIPTASPVCTRTCAGPTSPSATSWRCSTAAAGGGPLQHGSRMHKHRDASAALSTHDQHAQATWMASFRLVGTFSGNDTIRCRSSAVATRARVSSRLRAPPPSSSREITDWVVPIRSARAHWMESQARARPSRRADPSTGGPHTYRR